MRDRYAGLPDKVVRMEIRRAERFAAESVRRRIEAIEEQNAVMQRAQQKYGGTLRTDRDGYASLVVKG